MSLPLYMDQHVPAAVTRGLRQRGVDVLTAQEDGASTWDDERLLQRATDLGRVLFSQDRDHLALADLWGRTGREFAGLAYAPQTRVSVGEAARDLELIAKVYDPDDMRNRVEHLPYP